MRIKNGFKIIFIPGIILSKNIPVVYDFIYEYVYTCIRIYIHTCIWRICFRAHIYIYHIYLYVYVPMLVTTYVITIYMHVLRYLFKHVLFCLIAGR